MRKNRIAWLLVLMLLLCQVSFAEDALLRGLLTDLPEGSILSILPLDDGSVLIHGGFDGGQEGADSSVLCLSPTHELLWRYDVPYGSELYGGPMQMLQNGQVMLRSPLGDGAEATHLLYFFDAKTGLTHITPPMFCPRVVPFGDGYMTIVSPSDMDESTFTWFDDTHTQYKQSTISLPEPHYDTWLVKTATCNRLILWYFNPESDVQFSLLDFTEDGELLQTHAYSLGQDRVHIISAVSDEDTTLIAGYTTSMQGGEDIPLPFFATVSADGKCTVSPIVGLEGAYPMHLLPQDDGFQLICMHSNEIVSQRLDITGVPLSGVSRYRASFLDDDATTPSINDAKVDAEGRMLLAGSAMNAPANGRIRAFLMHLDEMPLIEATSDPVPLP